MLNLSEVVTVRTIAQEMNMALPAASNFYNALSKDAQMVVDKLCRRLNEEMFKTKMGSECDGQDQKHCVLSQDIQ